MGRRVVVVVIVVIIIGRDGVRGGEKRSRGEARIVSIYLLYVSSI